jgi:hypothetical protein
MKKIIITILILLVSTVILLAATKGREPLNAGVNDTGPGSALESTNSTSRYVLTEALAENGSIFLNLDQAQAASPDVSEKDGKFFTLFTPGISFVGVPFYLIGKQVGYPQIFTFFSSVVFSVINIYLVARLAQLMGAGFIASYIAGFLFIFATNTFAYTLTFTQHIMSTTVILMAIINAEGVRTLRKNIEFGIVSGAAILFDIPNVFMLLPIGLYVLYKHIQTSDEANKYILSVKTIIIGLAIGILPFVGLFFWYNIETTGSPTNTAQIVGRTLYFADQKTKELYVDENPEDNKFEAHSPFQPRLMLNSGYILLFSNERSWYYYSPAVLLGILGLFLAYKRRSLRPIVLIAITVVSVNILIYSMFGDPWGGWSFGARYLIPAAAILSAALGVALTKYKDNFFFVPIFFGLVCYSIGISTIGALTTAAIPPKQEAETLANPIPYTYDYNLEMVNSGKLSPLIYNVYLKDKMPARQFVTLFILAEFGVFIFAYIALVLEKDKEIA